MSVERHELLEGDVGAYVLGALSEVEERRFERHLAECPVCEDEVERLRPAVAALPRSVLPMTPPASIKASLMETVQAEAHERAGTQANRRPRPLAAVVRSARRTARALGEMSPGVAWVAASLVLMAGVVSGAAGYFALDRVITDEPVEEPASRSIVAKVDETRVPFGSGRLVVASDLQDGAVLHVHGLRPLEQGGVYQIWLRRKGEEVPQSLFTVGEDGDGAGAVVDDLGRADAVMVTREPAGGSKAPGEEPILTVPL